VGERVSYAVAGKAQRQAHARAREAGLSFGEWRVLDAVLDVTTAYSKLADEVARTDVARRAGLSPDRTAKALAKLAGHGLLYYRAGLGAGNLSIVAVPPPGEKGDVYASAFGAGGGEKGDAQRAPFDGAETSPFEQPERRLRGRGKGDVQRARVRTEEREVQAERLTEEETVRAGSSSRPKLATSVGEGTAGSARDGARSIGADEQAALFDAGADVKEPPWA
jgi:hypothetical protein